MQAARIGRSLANACKIALSRGPPGISLRRNGMEQAVVTPAAGPRHLVRQGGPNGQYTTGMNRRPARATMSLAHSDLHELLLCRVRCDCPDAPPPPAAASFRSAASGPHAPAATFFLGHTPGYKLQPNRLLHFLSGKYPGGERRSREGAGPLFRIGQARCQLHFSPAPSI